MCLQVSVEVSSTAFLVDNFTHQVCFQTQRPTSPSVIRQHFKRVNVCLIYRMCGFSSPDVYSRHIAQREVLYLSTDGAYMVPFLVFKALLEMIKDY